MNLPPYGSHEDSPTARALFAKLMALVEADGGWKPVEQINVMAASTSKEADPLDASILISFAGEPDDDGIAFTSHVALDLTTAFSLVTEIGKALVNVNAKLVERN